MTTTPTPGQVFEQLATGITGGDWTRLPDLYAEDAVVEMPFALPSPVRLNGRDEVRKHFAQPVPFTLRALSTRVHETVDPEVIVAEYDYELRATDTSLRVSNIQVLRVRDGLIVESRDYHNHAAMASVLSAS
jgi:ketosteroid isomerase-like protein